jgi:hypothetical protein
VDCDDQVGLVKGDDDPHANTPDLAGIPRLSKLIVVRTARGELSTPPCRTDPRRAVELGSSHVATAAYPLKGLANESLPTKAVNAGSKPDHFRWLKADHPRQGEGRLVIGIPPAEPPTG